MTENNGIERRREAVVNEGRFTKLETQVDRLISDAESEKETRARTNLSISQDIIKVDAKIDLTLGSIKLLLQEQEKKTEERSKSHDKRILKIENKIIWFSAVTSTFVSIIAFVAHWFFK